MLNSYISIDLETTGLNPKTDRIVEIGALKVLNGCVKDSYSVLIKPYRQLEERTVSLTGITDEMLAGAPGVEAVIGEAVDFCDGLPLLGHHIIFDFSFLKRAAVNAGLEFEKNGMDTLKLCRLFMPAEEKKNLAAACAYYRVGTEGAHRALTDAWASHELYQRLKTMHGEDRPEAFSEKPLIYKVKKEQPATKRQKEYLRDLIKYHRICLTVEIDYMTRNEASRITDQILAQYGKYKRGESNV